jgi:hypothetical protein
MADPLKLCKTASIYEALGFALCNWQHVETSHHIVHCALGTSDEKSSIVFFRIRSPSAKVALAVALLGQVFEKDYLDKHWKRLAADLNDALKARNHLVHFELQQLTYCDSEQRDVVRSEPALTEPFHDISSHQQSTVKSREALEKTALEFIRVSRELMKFAGGHFHPSALPQKFGELALRNLIGISQSKPPRHPCGL